MSSSELVGAPVISALLNHLVPMISDEIYSVWNVNKEMKQLQRTLESIQAVLNDAEEQQVHSRNIRLWLRDLKNVGHVAEDILDEFAYESLRAEIETRKRERLQNFFSKSNFAVLRIKMSGKLKDLNEQLDKIDHTKRVFNLTEAAGKLRISDTAVSNIVQFGRETTSYVNPSEIIGREGAASEVKNLLINSSNNQESSSIIRIIGMGGIGKTALAQIVYNDDAVKRHFTEKKWICISQHSNQKRVFNNLLGSVLFDRKYDESLSLEVLECELRKWLQNKKYLIVLDDIWNDRGNEWDAMLKTLLQSMGAQGSKVIVTTRSSDVIASLKNSLSLSDHNLGGLPEEESWVLLEKVAFGSDAQKPAHLIEIGKSIAKKCGGVPLAIRVLGGLMCDQRSVEMWQSIDKNAIWDQPEGEEKIINVLKLSYDNLEPHLKQCFTYCSLFPKDHIIKKKILAQLWMAEGFLSSNKPNTEMEVGDKYFISLLRNSFFQDVQTDEMGNIKSCKMHDLVHDLAEYLTKKECSVIYINNIPDREKLDSLRRISLFTDQSPFPDSLSIRSKKLRTFLCTSPKFADSAYALKQIFRNFSRLRVLDLTYFPGNELPSSIADLKYLRYLNLSYSQLTELPDSITTLYNLQILILKNCFQLKYLPRDLIKLVNLRHLICKNKSSECISLMPSQVRKLINLQYLPAFTVGNKNYGFGIEELSTLNLLGRKLRIHNLENVSSREEAERACLGEKQHLFWLELHWKVTETGIYDDLEGVLQGLQPHQNLKKLKIYNYAGSNFSTWMMNLNNLLPYLATVVLENCTKCEKLPPLGLLPFLKVLKLEGFLALEYIDREFYTGDDNSSLSPFPCLEDLSIIRMDKLQEWYDYVSDSPSCLSSSFPVLEKFKVSFCPKLKSMPTFISSLQSLEINCCTGDTQLISYLIDYNIQSLTFVSIGKCEELVFLPPKLLKGNYMLKKLLVSDCNKFKGFFLDQDLTTEEEEDVDQDYWENVLDCLLIEGCPSLHCWPNLSRFGMLFELTLSYCGSQKSLPSGVENLPGLEILGTGGFSKELDSFPFPAANIIDGRIDGDYFPSLGGLYLTGWSKLTCLPDQLQYLTSLQTLEISKFDSLEVLPEWLGNMASLDGLSFMYCKNLKYMPSKEQMLRLISLKTLRIDECPLLAGACREGGEEHDKIRHVLNILIDQEDEY